MDRNTIVKVLNRDNGAVVYSIPQMNGLRRVFQSGETKEVTFEELQKLSYIPGGGELLKESLVILDSPEVIQTLLGTVEPEYNYNKDDIIKLMKQGSLDEFLDCLDFAPEGVKELIKTLSVQLPLNDVQKREAILEKLDFNVDTAIRLQKEAMEETSDGQHQEPTGRRVTKSQAPVTGTVRRTTVKKNN